MNDHIFECDQCSRLFDSPGKVRATYEWCKKTLNEEELLGTEHLEYEQLVGYVDAGAPELRRLAVIEGRTAACPPIALRGNHTQAERLHDLYDSSGDVITERG